MINRIMVALILVPITIYVYLYGGKSLLIFTMFLIGVGTYEIYDMMGKKDIIVNKSIGILMGISIPILLYLPSVYSSFHIVKTVNSKTNIFIVVPIIIIGIFILMGIRVFQNRVIGSSSYIGYTVLGFLYVGVMLSHIICIKQLINGGQWLITIQILVWISDTFAYLVGMKLGRKIFPTGLSQISPKKSIEGSIGSLVFTVIAMFIIKIFLFQNLNISGIHLIIVPLLISLVSQIGDLSESVFKREFGAKDSGKILGGHGGILDRYDSLIWVFPLMYYYIILFL